MSQLVLSGQSLSGNDTYASEADRKYNFIFMSTHMAMTSLYTNRKWNYRLQSCDIQSSQVNQLANQSGFHMSLRLYSCFRDTAGKIKLNDTYIATTCHDWHLVSWSGNDAMSIGSAARLAIHLLSTSSHDNDIICTKRKWNWRLKSCVCTTQSSGQLASLGVWYVNSACSHVSTGTNIIDSSQFQSCDGTCDLRYAKL